MPPVMSQGPCIEPFFDRPGQMADAGEIDGTGRIRLKKRLYIYVLMCLLLSILSGCTGKEELGADRETEAEDSGRKLAVSVKPMELLQFKDPDNKNLADMLQRSGDGMMVQLQAGGLLGSGVICGTEEERLLILTAAHVLEAAENAVSVTFVDGLRVSTNDFTCSETGDFAVVRVSGGDVPEDTLEQCLRANIDKDSLDAAVSGQGCIVMGSRSGVAAEAYEGVILDHWVFMKDYGQYMMWVKAEGRQGMSGGGLFDRQGHFLGIISGGNEDGELAVVPLSLILAEFENIIKNESGGLSF